MAPACRRSGTSAAGIGAGGTIVFGIWLAFSVGGYDIWDGWIIAALVLWALAGPRLGGRTGKAYMAGHEEGRRSSRRRDRLDRSEELLALNRTQRGVVLHAIASVARCSLILIDMIWKPGA